MRLILNESLNKARIDLMNLGAHTNEFSNSFRTCKPISSAQFVYVVSQELSLVLVLVYQDFFLELVMVLTSCVVLLEQFSLP